jgi:benzoyl-CoA reductase subunit A
LRNRPVHGINNHSNSWEKGIKEEKLAMMEENREYWRWPEGAWTSSSINWQEGEYITAGVDIGSVSSQSVVMVDGQLFAYGNTRTGADSPDSARKALALALHDTGLKEGNIDYCIGTGYGRVNVPMAQQTVTEIACHARGAHFMYGPSVKTVLDIGGQDSKVIRCDADGKVIKFIMNDKCAAGTGRGMEIFADLIGVPVWEIGARSFLIEKQPAPVSSTCVIFAKSEVVGLLEEGLPENDIIAAYCAAMAHRIVELLNRLGIEREFAVTGGIAKNIGIIKRIEEEIGLKSLELTWYDPDYRVQNIPFDTQIAGAIGAAFFAYHLLGSGKVKSVRKR